MVRLALAVLYMNKDDYASAEQVHLEGLKLRPNSAERIKIYADFLSDAGEMRKPRSNMLGPKKPG